MRSRWNKSVVNKLTSNSLQCISVSVSGYSLMVLVLASSVVLLVLGTAVLLIKDLFQAALGSTRDFPAHKGRTSLAWSRNLFC